jgi:hypothetical protein
MEQCRTAACPALVAELVCSPSVLFFLVDAGKASLAASAPPHRVGAYSWCTAGVDLRASAR